MRSFSCRTSNFTGVWGENELKSGVAKGWDLIAGFLWTKQWTEVTVPTVMPENRFFGWRIFFPCIRHCRLAAPSQEGSIDKAPSLGKSAGNILRSQ
jgi:hypothetical protein